MDIAFNQIAKLNKEIEELKSLKNGNQNSFRYIGNETKGNKENSQPERNDQSRSLLPNMNQNSQLLDQQNISNGSLNLTQIILAKCTKDRKESKYKQRFLGDLSRFHTLLERCNIAYSQGFKVKVSKIHEFLKTALGKLLKK